MNEDVLGWLAIYGLPVLFAVLVIASAGIPFPITLMMVVAGAFVQAGEMQFWPVVFLGTAGAVAGDNIGYALGRYGGRQRIDWIAEKLGGRDKIVKAEQFTCRWGATGIFFSRWLVTPLGPWINITGGLAAYPWPKFLIWDILGEFIWVLIYVMLGRIFSDRVEEIASFAGNLTWLLVGLAATGAVAFILIKSGKRDVSEA